MVNMVLGYGIPMRHGEGSEGDGVRDSVGDSLETWWSYLGYSVWDSVGDMLAIAVSYAFFNTIYTADTVFLFSRLLSTVCLNAKIFPPQFHLLFSSYRGFMNSLSTSSYQRSHRLAQGRTIVLKGITSSLALHYACATVSERERERSFHYSHTWIVWPVTRVWRMTKDSVVDGQGEPLYLQSNIFLNISPYNRIPSPSFV